MAKAARATPRRRRSSLPDDMVVWEILVRLPPKSLLRCRSVCRAWRHVTSTRNFLLAHHRRQPSHLIFSGSDILAFDHLQLHTATDDDRFHTVAQLDQVFSPVASRDGLLVLSKQSMHFVGSSSCLSICNPATREHAPLGLPWYFGVMGMYLHRPTGEYRLLLQRSTCKRADRSPKDQLGCYVFALGSDQPPRYIGWPEITSTTTMSVPFLVRDSLHLHWYPVYHENESKGQWNEWKRKLIVFDTIAESFRQMSEPTVPCNSHMCEVDGTLGIYAHNHSTGVIDIVVLQNYERELWDLKYHIKLPIAEIRMKFENECDEYCHLDADDSYDYWDFNVFSVDSGVLFLVCPRWLLHVDSDGKLVNSFYRGRRGPLLSLYWLKQSLVQHTFFPALEGYVVNASPFIGPVE